MSAIQQLSLFAPAPQGAQGDLFFFAPTPGKEAVTYYAVQYRKDGLLHTEEHATEAAARAAHTARSADTVDLLTIRRLTRRG